MLQLKTALMDVRLLYPRQTTALMEAQIAEAKMKIKHAAVSPSKVGEP